MKCAFSTCNNNADTYIHNNINKGFIPICDKCLELYQKHLQAREEMFYRRGKEDGIKETLKSQENQQ